MMSNVAYLNDPFERHNLESEAIFGIKECPVYFHDGAVFTKNDQFKQIVRKVSPEHSIPLGLVGKGFAAVENSEFFGAVEEAIRDRMDISGVTIRDNVAYDGARCRRTYTFRNYATEPAVGDIVAFKLWAWNAFDGSLAFRVGAGGERLVCLNGMTTSNDVDVTVRKHTSGVTISGLTSRIPQYVANFEKQAESWGKWTNKKISSQDVQHLIEAFPGISKRLGESIGLEYYKQVRETGETLWTLYNVMTFFASHNSDQFAVRNTTNDNEAYSLYQRERRVLAWQNTPAFARLAA